MNNAQRTALCIVQCFKTGGIKIVSVNCQSIMDDRSEIVVELVFIENGTITNTMKF